MDDAPFQLPGLGFPSVASPIDKPSAQDAVTVTDTFTPADLKGTIKDVLMHDINDTTPAEPRASTKKRKHAQPTSEGRKHKRSQASHTANFLISPATHTKDHALVMPSADVRQTIKKFIGTWHAAGLTFHQLLQEVHSVELLTELYLELGLSTLPVYASGKDSPAPAPVTVPSKELVRALNHTKSKPDTPLSAISAMPKPPAVPTRSEYLARLQAARSSKSASSTTSSTSPKQTTPRDLPSQPNPAPTSVPAKQSDPTELVRKKMEALKAYRKPASDAASTSGAGQARSVPSTPPVTSVPLAQATVPPVVTNTDSARATPPALLPRHGTVFEPAASRSRSFDQATIRPSRDSFGSVAHHGPDESMVFELSDDESSSSKDGAEQDSVSMTAAIMPVVDSPRIRSLVARPPMSRSASNSGVMSANAESDELKRKQLEIAALNQRIAEMERRRRAQAALDVSRLTARSVQSDTETPRASGPLNSSSAASIEPISASELVQARMKPDLVADMQALRSASAPLPPVIQSQSRSVPDEPTYSEAVQKKRRQMADLQKQMEQIQAELDGERQSEQVSSIDAVPVSNELQVQETTALSSAPVIHAEDEELHDSVSAPLPNTVTKHDGRDNGPVRSISPASSAPSVLDEPAKSIADPLPVEVVDTIEQNDQAEDDRSVHDDTDAEMDMASSDEEPSRYTHDLPQSSALQGPISISRGPSISDPDSRVKQIENGASIKKEREDQALISDSSRESSYGSSDAGSNTLDVDRRVSTGEPFAGLGTAPELCTTTSTESITDQFLDRISTQGFYRPYHSPLQTFKQYRFHPEYRKQVAGGFRSRTFSHQIDSNEAMCRFELDGGICNDPACVFQHFRTIDLSDDMILVQMGSHEANPGRDEGERERYRSGLMDLVRQLRVENIGDIEEVAGRIAQYRRDFVGDASVVLVT